MPKPNAYSDFAHLKDNNLLAFVLSLGNDGEQESEAAAKGRAKAEEAKKLAKLQNLKTESGEKISQAQKQQLVKMMQRCALRARALYPARALRASARA